MFGKASRGAYGLTQRDRQLSQLKTRLSLAQAARNRQEQTRLTGAIKRLSQSL